MIIIHREVRWLLYINPYKKNPIALWNRVLKYGLMPVNKNFMPTKEINYGTRKNICRDCTGKQN